MKQAIMRSLHFFALDERAKSVKYSLMRLKPTYVHHKKEMVRFYSQFVNKGDLCFDVGANIGDRTEVFLELGATVVAIEPQHACMRQLRIRYGSNNRVILIEKALGAEEGEGELLIPRAHTISSMSNEWIKSVRSSGRFQNYAWERKEAVTITTLDRLMEEFGKPSFCKIDVEGFEFQVLKGLSQPIRGLSFEFTLEFIDPTVHCVKRLLTLGNPDFNYSVGESMCWALPSWVNSDAICQDLRNITDKTIMGDVYARFFK